MNITKPCAYCGKTITKGANVSLRVWSEQTKYCSRECYWKAKNQPPKKVCPVCGKLFKSKIWSSKAVYCSDQCSSAAQRKPLPVCGVCGKPCSKVGRRFCSPECKKLWYRGDKVYCYVGENIRKNAYPTSYSFWMKIAKEIRQRDKVCRHCGMTPKENGRALDVHHIIPYRISKDNSPSNLIALCRACHKKADATIRVS